MKILLTHAYFLHEDEKELAIMKPYPPLGLQCISAYLEVKGYDNDIFDTTFSSFDDFTQTMLDNQPRVIGIYTNLMTKLNVLRMMSWIKDQPSLAECKIILGGPEVRHHREQFIKHGADAIVFGEGEDSMLELIQQFEQAGPHDLSQITGIAYPLVDGSIMVNVDRPLIKDLDELPLPNRKKIDQQKYFDAWKNRHGYSMITINTMRGCPYACKWCSRAVYGKTYRRRSPENVVDEILDLKANYQFDKIWFVDDVFTINHKWLREFSRLMVAKGAITPYEVISRADRMNDEVLRLLKDSGCFRVWIGAESGSQAILDAMTRMVKVEQVAAMIKQSQAHGIEAGTFIMLGYPGETEKDLKATLNYLIDANPDHYTLTVAYPIKGTALYEEVENVFVEDLPWDNSTDRDIDFKRTYPRKYYDHAIHWIHHEINFNRILKANPLNYRLLTSKLRAWKSRAGMMMIRYTG